MKGVQAIIRCACRACRFRSRKIRLQIKRRDSPRDAPRARCLGSSVTIYAIFLPELLRFGGTTPSCCKCCKSIIQGGMSKPIQPDQVKKCTRSGHNVGFFRVDGVGDVSVSPTL